jgi:2-oxoglutarate ferredoxin oxidoreductase subunit alpha
VIDRPVELGLVGRREIAASQQEPYRRYLVTESGISPMAIPGTAASMYTADGLEHGERGTPSSQARDHLAQLDKRRRKLDAVDYGSLWADIEGEGEVAVVTWGSCTAAVREAIERARADGVSAKLVSMRLLSPAQPDRLREALKGVKRMLVVEQTYSGQFHRYLRAEYTLSPEIDAIHRPGPLPIRPDEIHRQLVQWGAI